MSMKKRYLYLISLPFALIIASCTRATVQGTQAAFNGLALAYTFPTTSVNTASTLVVNLQNTGQTDALSVQAAFSNSVFSMTGGKWPGSGGTCGTKIPAGSACTVNLSFLPSTGGVTTGSLTVSFFDGQQTTNWVSNLSGSGIPEGTLDTSFGTGGIAQYDFGHNEMPNAINIQADGKLLLFGNTDNASAGEDIMAVRLTMAGALDTTFGTNGLETTNTGSNDYGYASVIDSSTGLLEGVGMSGSRALLVSCTANGTLSSSFGILGISILSPLAVGSSDVINDVANLGDGRVYVAGSVAVPLLGAVFYIARVATNGFLDLSIPTFGLLGDVLLTNFAPLSTDVAQAIGTQSNGSVVVAGSSLTGGYLHSAMTRVTSTGTVDTTFGTSGQVLVDMCGTAKDNVINAVTFDLNFNIIVAGYCTNAANNKDAFIARYSTIGGALDITFGTGGITKIDVAGHDDVIYKVAVLPNGQIVAGGYSNNGTVDQFLLLSLNADGSRNTAFGTNGVVTTTLTGNSRAKGMAIQPDGKIVLDGYSTGATTNIAVARYYP